MESGYLANEGNIRKGDQELQQGQVLNGRQEDGNVGGLRELKEGNAWGPLGKGGEGGGGRGRGMNG